MESEFKYKNDIDIVSLFIELVFSPLKVYRRTSSVSPKSTLI